MKTDFADLYGTKLSIDDGHVGMHNFHPLGWEAVKARYPGQRQTLYCDVLRSEHIPFNLFSPLENHKQVLAAVLNKFMQQTIQTVDRIVIEFAPQPKANYLNDATSFDAYIEYTHTSGALGIIGIEVKYTEGDYKIGNNEALAVQNPDSPYWRVTRQSNIHKPDCYSQLITDRFRQVWRNQLLGESIKLRHPDKWKHFTLAMIYPSGNTHIEEVTQEYRQLLVAPTNTSFIPISYQSYLQACNECISDDELNGWVNWCVRRYAHA